MALASSAPSGPPEFTPVSFQTPKDPLGMAISQVSQTQEAHPLDETKRPSLTKIVLSLATPAKQQEALGYIQTALQIAYARATIVNSLGGMVQAAQETDQVVQEGALSSLEMADALSPSDLPAQSQVPMPHHGLDSFTIHLTAGDARVMVDLLKLAVAGRVGERGKETLAAVLASMAKANHTVRPHPLP